MDTLSLDPAGSAALQHPATPDAPTQGFARDLHAALGRAPHSISPKYFYDAQGSRLFEAICELPEYYPTRTEIALLERHGREIARTLGPQVQLVEYGAGALRKVRLLLQHLQDLQSFVPVDISGEHLLQAVQLLRHEMPRLRVQPVVADFTAPHELPALPPGARRVGFFPGSSLGNFLPHEALGFLRLCAQELRGGGLLIGVDLVKDPAVLHAAYNDRAGVTAQFNLNLLTRARRELGLQVQPELFAHSAFYNAPQRRIEMHLQSLRDQSLVLQGRHYRFARGQCLHTEHSHKFSPEGFEELARRAGLQPRASWIDARQWFALYWLEALPAAAPARLH
ncbi:L-histidine N(alpha)-methyltransferase [Pelomonas sp. CA6]|uniref:L-histidine N(alpha)-methyltransferase n=1 Tax=Pelomonas sp. CA6 TaxID=2907999 RepID=UPI001F4AB55C|nr:L-histidine N(alpha)-methyltransferase [Pelomonas sp. CA6]MCH7342022.1 L-histidine N(alpha)-methyltransferase [Pelomonas sp. CA6]